MKIANVLISESWGEVSPEALNKGIGGREGAMIYLSREWARYGHEVTNFVNVELGQRFHEEFHLNDVVIDGEAFYKPGYHEYVPLSLTKPMLANFPWDVVIAWECPSVFDDERIRKNVELRLCEMQVCHLSDKEMVSAEQNLDYMCTLSPWHKQFVLHSGLKMHEDNVVVFPNGVQINRYPRELVEPKFTKEVGKNPKFIYSSSPDRGLWYLLQSWPHIRKEFPEAELFVGYGVKKWTEPLKWAHHRVGEMALEINRLMKQPGVTDLGKIGQDHLSKLQLEADAWLYPFDPMSPTESGCITAVENAAAGNVIITTDADCMEGEFGKIGVIQKLPFNAEEYAEKVTEVLTDQPYVEYLRTVARDFAEKRDWRLISKQWTKFFYGQN